MLPTSISRHRATHCPEDATRLATSDSTALRTSAWQLQSGIPRTTESTLSWDRGEMEAQQEVMASRRATRWLTASWSFRACRSVCRSCSTRLRVEEEEDKQTRGSM